MKRIACILTIGTAMQMSTSAAVVIARNGKAECVIVCEADATAPEKNAARELAQTLKQITGAEFAIEAPAEKLQKRALFVGPGAAARKVFPEVPFDQLGPEELVIKTKGGRLLMAGGSPRGTLYAVSRFLKDQCGVRWWTPWASRIPSQPTLRIAQLDVRTKPAFEYREPYWFPAFSAEWAVRNCVNGQSANIPPEKGGCIRYKGFVHTFYPLVPPEKHFAEHPEWFSQIKGQRTTKGAQLCLTNPKLRDFMVEQVKAWLRASPESGIVSVSQNDWYGACECDNCKALDDAEGSYAGTLLAFVNYVAEKIELEFPHVAIDTLAYQYTRKPPRTLVPRPNVIVRLCSIECNFREPLSAAANAKFADDIRGWSKICRRLYIWDYTTDFAHYVQPHPNYFVLGPNLRFFRTNHVLGVFEQGAYQSHGSEMAELRAWVLAQLLWNPQQDDRKLIYEFLDGYYGLAAQPIRQYLEQMWDAARGYNLTCFAPTDTPFLKFKTLAPFEDLWQQAELAVADNREQLARVRLARLPGRYAWLSRWTQLRKECVDAKSKWPLPASRKQVAEEWRAVAGGVAGWPWTKVTLVNESGLTPEKFLAQFAEDPPEANKN
jgi:hypothetical protein